MASKSTVLFGEPYPPYTDLQSNGEEFGSGLLEGGLQGVGLGLGQSSLKVLRLRLN